MSKTKMPWEMLDDAEDNKTLPLAIPFSDDYEVADDEKLKEVYPLLALRNTVVFPGAIVPIVVTRPKSSRLIKAMTKSEGEFVVAAQKDPSTEVPTIGDLYETGTLVRIVKVIDLPDGDRSVLLQGRSRMRIVSLESDTPYDKVKTEIIRDEPLDKAENKEFDATCSLIKERLKRIAYISDKGAHKTGNLLSDLKADSFFLNVIASSSEFTLENKQKMLEMDSQIDKANMLLECVTELLQFVELKNKIQTKVTNGMNQQQKEYMLTQQIKAIQEELGTNPIDKKINELKSKSAQEKFPLSVKKILENEIEALERTNPNAMEHTVQLNYIEAIQSLPWNTYTEDNYDIQRARKRLDADHFGLEKVKERILEHLAVLKLKGDMKSPILCLYGPPGVGKTSLGKSIAEALGRSYVRMSLGGMHDEAEIRGHRKTYVGAMMGRILQSLKKAGTSNPVFILDEIDKITVGNNGDPSAALLEVLDPEQNIAFHDNYLDIDYDLSKVLFIATANDIGRISRPLLDRMELVEVSGYVQEEKVEIANKHLLPKEMENHGLDKKTFSISKSMLSYIIERYTRESGVRELDKTLASICRKIALKSAQKEDFNKSLKKEDISTLLGPERHVHDIWEDNLMPGVVTGLAWTAVGGEILFVESSISKGKGKVTLTGNLGDIMKESAILALEYIRANSGKFGLEGTNFDEQNVHVHVPEGAIPKDGPSAGITMVTAMVSAMTKRNVRKRLAMTGEITLRGAVLPVGGIKEKILAAKRAGIKEIVLSEANQKDVAEIDELYINGVTFHYVKTIDEVIAKALE